MAQTQLVQLGGTGTVNAEDSVASTGTIMQRDSQGGAIVNKMTMTEAKSTGIVTWSFSAKTTSFTVDNTATVWRCDATGGALVPTLPAAASCPGRIYAFKKLDNVNNVTITGSGAETIDGSNTKVLSTQYAHVMIQSNGVSWDVIA